MATEVSTGRWETTSLQSSSVAVLLQVPTDTNGYQWIPTVWICMDLYGMFWDCVFLLFLIWRQGLCITVGLTPRQMPTWFAWTDAICSCPPGLRGRLAPLHCRTRAPNPFHLIESMSAKWMNRLVLSIQDVSGLCYAMLLFRTLDKTLI